jgi:Ca2+-binding RTX toxin-like protein
VQQQAEINTTAVYDRALNGSLIPTRRKKAMLRRAHPTNPFIARLALVALATVILLGTSLTDVQAALQSGGLGDVCGGQSDVLIGQDNDNIDNPLIQPPDTAANQSLDNADVFVGGGGGDILIGLLGSDVMDGGEGNDILIGGTEQGETPNSDIMFGGPGDDIASGAWRWQRGVHWRQWARCASLRQHRSRR